MPIVDHDCIVFFQTLEWKTLDVETTFDLAEHIDYDIHVSMLYDVGLSDPQGFTGMRVGFPADKETRIGMINPPASPRRFTEERISGTLIEGGVKFVGQTDVKHHESAAGVQNRIYLKNNTSISYVELMDSPIAAEEVIFDANALYDDIGTIPTTEKTSNQLELVVSDHVDLGDEIYLYDDLTVDYMNRLISGNIYCRYNPSRLHILDIHVDPDGWNPDVSIYGLDTLANSLSPVTISISYKSNSYSLLPAVCRSGLTIRLLCSFLPIYSGATSYQWVEKTYALDGVNWRIDTSKTFYPTIVSCLSPGTICSMPKKSVAVRRSFVDEGIISMPISSINNVYPSITPCRSFGNVRGLNSTDQTIKPMLPVYTGLTNFVSCYKTTGKRILPFSYNDLVRTSILVTISEPARAHTSMASWY